MSKEFKRVATLLAVLLVASISLSACGLGVTGSGRLETQEMNLKDFTTVRAGSAFEVDIVQGDVFNVTITADDNLLRYIEAETSGRTLTLQLQPNRTYRTGTFRAKITMPAIEGIDFSGAAHGTIRGFKSASDFRLRLSGAAALNGEIEVGDADFGLSGASNAALKGAATTLNLKVSGGSSTDLSEFVVNEADVALSGASSATVNARDTLDANLSGASTLSYMGDPRIGRQTVSGASRMQRR
jgi:hypothetical protein